jgi:hypothetical protein
MLNYEEKKKAITCVEMSNEFLGVGCANGKIYLISLEELKNQKENQDQILDNNIDSYWPCAVECLAFNPDRKWLFSGGRDSKIKVWNIEKEPKLAQSLDHPSEHQDWVWSLEICPHNKSEFFLAAGYRNGTVVFWKLNSENLIRKKNNKIYYNLLSKNKNINLLKIEDFNFQNFLEFPIFCKEKEELSEYLFKKGIETRFYYYKNCEEILLKKNYYKNKNSSQLENQLLCLPSHDKIDKKQVIKTCNYIEKFFRN